MIALRIILRNVLALNGLIALGDVLDFYQLPEWTPPVQFLLAGGLFLLLWQLPGGTVSTTRVRADVPSYADVPPKRATRDDVR